MGKLATSKYIYDTFSLGTSSPRFPTKSEVVNLGLTVSGSYANNQLVDEIQVSQSVQQIKFYFDISVLEYLNPPMRNLLNSSYKNSATNAIFFSNNDQVYITSFTYTGSTKTILQTVSANSGSWERDGNYFILNLFIQKSSTYDTYYAFTNSSGTNINPNLSNNFLQIDFSEGPWHSQFPQLLYLPVQLSLIAGNYYFAKTKSTSIYVNLTFWVLMSIKFIIDLNNSSALANTWVQTHISQTDPTVYSPFTISTYIVNSIGTSGTGTRALVPLSTVYSEQFLSQEDGYLYFVVSDVSVSLIHDTYYMFGDPDTTVTDADNILVCFENPNTSTLEIQEYLLEDTQCTNNTYKADNYYLDYIPSYSASMNGEYEYWFGGEQTIY